MKAFSIEEPFKLRDCIPDDLEKKILEAKVDPSDSHSVTANYNSVASETLVDKLGEKINEIESLLRLYFEEKKELSHSFKWTLTRDFEMRLFEVYFLGKEELTIQKDVAAFSAVSAYPPPPKPKIIGYTPV